MRADNRGVSQARRVSMRGTVASIAVASIALALVPNPARANGRFPAANMLVARPGDPSHRPARDLRSPLFGRRRRYLGLVLRASGGLRRKRGSHDCGDRQRSHPRRHVPELRALDERGVRVAARPEVAGVGRRHGPAAERTRPGVRCLLPVLEGRRRRGPALSLGAPRSPTTPARPGRRADARPFPHSRQRRGRSQRPKRLYVSAIRRTARRPKAYCSSRPTTGRASRSARIPLETADRGVYIAAVDPKRADRIYFRTRGVHASRVVVTDDGGKTTRAAFEGVGPLLGFALADDGATIYAGGPKDGLVVASGAVPAKEIQFTKRSPQSIQCLTAVGATLWACTPASSGFVLGASSDGGATFTSKLTLPGMRGPLKCLAPADCKAEWASFRELVGANDAKDAGPRKPSPPSPPPPESRACGCATPGKRGGLDADFAWPLCVALTWSLARRRSARVGSRLRVRPDPRHRRFELGGLREDRADETRPVDEHL